ncbi:MAG TPA: EAL domain-containing protein [Nocardioidaceae bacterium]|nr:EAL domain-containing protein [Nocardioidaceae bacterium]
MADSEAPMMAERLRAAIAGQRLDVHFQPVLDLSDGATVGVETLARWYDEELGHVPPDRFIALAESTGMVVDLGRWVLRKACRRAVDWTTADREDLLLSVNVSPVQLREESFPDDVTAALEESGLPAHRLCLEVTETAIVSDVAEVAATLWRLRDLGVQFALDDFGTGHSSLTLLRNLPLQIVKIDRSLIRRVAVDAQDAVLVQLVIDAAHTLGLRVCAEGVEEEVQARQLVAMGCDTGQGWLFGRPVPMPDLDHSWGPVSGAGSWLQPTESELVPLSGSENLVLVADRGRRVTYVSASCRRILGRMPSELVGRPLADVLGDDPEDGPVTIRLEHKEHDFRWVRGIVQSLTDGAGQVREVLCVLTDVTSALRREKELADSEELFRSAFHGAPIGIALSDFGGRLLRVNPAMAELVGRSVEELLEMSVADITHPDDVRRDEVNLTEVREGAAEQHLVRKRYLRPDGQVVPVEVHAASVRTADGEPYCIVAHVLPA